MTAIALSPSRASDFKTCPQLFKYRAIDRIAEPEDPASARGTLVHLVLEKLLGCDPSERSRDNIENIIEVAWESLREEAEQQGMVFSKEQEEIWLIEVKSLIDNYFAIEDPSLITAHELEWWVEHDDGNLFLRGIIDRVEVDQNEDWILSDYKTGRSPSETYALGAFFGL
ncbi:MAG: PD-(D/E)XK nuclease family protein, partial [Actinobacteria bacterium]|nr:PD-(D/E)XK nuclease family protein [Actinomycetota bacterium]